MRRRYGKMFRRILFVLFIIVLIQSVYGYAKPLPEGISVEGKIHQLEDVEFLFDLTYEREGEVVREQVIFDRLYSMIDQAERFIMLDMFLYNDDYARTDQDAHEVEYPTVSKALSDALIRKKETNPEIEIVVITDPINTFYGSYIPDHLAQLEESGIEVFYTNLSALKDSNPAWSGLWRTAFQWFGTEGRGWLPNPFSPDSPDVTLRSYFELVNFKANHRKVLITEQEAIITSGNPHDASAYHSNIAFVVRGDILPELIETEKAVAYMAGAPADRFESFIPALIARTESKQEREQVQEQPQVPYEVQLLTEGQIKKHLLEEISAVGSGERIRIGVFYFSDRDLVHALLQASERGAYIQLILDANKDAFGREKNGVPNRPVAHELIEESGGSIEVRWYNTNGEQYHTKMALFEKTDELVIIGGSANFTKRNIDDFNLETNVKITGHPDQEVMRQVSHYFEQIWMNDGGTYTTDYETYADERFVSKMLYRFQEWSGMSTF